MSARTSTTVDRRGFLRNSAATGALGIGMFHFVPAAALGAADAAPASERIGVALIGCGGMGQGNLANCARSPDVQVVGLCDVWTPRVEAAGRRYAGAKKYHDYQELLAGWGDSWQL